MSLPDTPSAPPNAQVPKRKKSRLTLYIGIAIVAAVGLAVTAPQVAVQFELGGEIFLRLLLMMVVPLVVASVMSGIIGLGDIRKLGRPGGFAIAYYLTTTVMAVIVGLMKFGSAPARRTIDRIFERHDLITKKRRRSGKPGHPGKPLTPMDEPNAVWTVDFKGQFKMRNGRYCYPLTIQDGFSRFLLVVSRYLCKRG